MKVLIYGHKGWIGSQFTSLLKSDNILYEEGKSRADSKHDDLQSISFICLQVPFGLASPILLNGARLKLSFRIDAPASG